MPAPVRPLTVPSAPRQATPVPTRTMPPNNNNNFGRLAQYVRGSSEPEPNALQQNNNPKTVARQQRERDDIPPTATATTTTYYPPASNPNTRLSIAEAAKIPLPKPSPQRGPGPGLHHLRQPSNASMPPLGSPPSLALPNPQHAPSTARRRRSNSVEKEPGIWSPSLPSNLATPFDSPKSNAEPRIDRQYSTRHGHGHGHGHGHANIPPTMHAAGDVYRDSTTPPPLARGIDDPLDVVEPRYGHSTTTYQGLHNTRQTGSTWQQNGTFPNEAIGFLSSPKRHPVKLAIHDAGLRRPYVVGNEETTGMQVNGRPSSPTLNRFSRGFTTYEEQPREPQHTAIVRRRDALEGDLRSDYPVSDMGDMGENDDDHDEDDRGTPRAKTKTERTTRGADGFLDSSPRLRTGSLSLADKIAQSIKKRTRDSCDYEDQALMQMSYSELKTQPFDLHPVQVAPGGAAANGVSVGESLPEKLAHFRSRGGEEQRQFFTQMSLQDWERSGDWFLEQFGVVAQKLKEARQGKRATVQSFEDEIARREESVRLRTEDINKRLGEIKHKGEDMLAGKGI
ncbi:hypothetical protein SODALDRAFT_359826 [Sodiomyces alkalinus F11]|uniref:Extracellular mutant protein 11 C-terminal domain-containing protein n=1 Tax=Sodiomyces alkalinus (strain CBS 110278 / VKM F-3762 / F11) TaxID=1314773 RepID=A0A3N2PW57_SODAK|nr:hypothetical protein SODALDRAFT_359826 [Sodiomyces alkalinus F11]ROT38724.1 hypothetical protein SODALDRAFT_359826 [Sodiomyces alkalinus F11]